MPNPEHRPPMGEPEPQQPPDQLDEPITINARGINDDPFYLKETGNIHVPSETGKTRFTSPEDLTDETNSRKEPNEYVADVNSNTALGNILHYDAWDGEGALLSPENDLDAAKVNRMLRNYAQSQPGALLMFDLDPDEYKDEEDEDEEE